MTDRIHQLLENDEYIDRQLIQSWLAGGLLQRMAFIIHQADVVAGRPIPSIQTLADYPQSPDRDGLYYADQLSNTLARWCVLALADPDDIILTGNDQNGYTQLYATIRPEVGSPQSFYIDYDRNLNPETIDKLFDRFEDAFDHRIKLPELPMDQAAYHAPEPHYQVLYRSMKRQAGRLLDEWDLRQPFAHDLFWSPQFQTIDIPAAYQLPN